MIPVAGQVEGFHKYIEFGNRTLTFLVLAISVALFVFSLLNEKRNIIIWSFLPLIGTLLQAVLGGITVLTGLHPSTCPATGIKEPGVQSGQVGQPKPEPVNRTIAPVTMIPD